MPNFFVSQNPFIQLICNKKWPHHHMYKLTWRLQIFCLWQNWSYELIHSRLDLICTVSELIKMIFDSNFAKLWENYLEKEHITTTIVILIIFDDAFLLRNIWKRIRVIRVLLIAGIWSMYYFFKEMVLLFCSRCH